jgi:signal transduction histidine kinase
LPDGTYALTDKKEDSKINFTLWKEKVQFKGESSSLFVIVQSNEIDKLKSKLIEDKYRGVLLSTITHEIKTPLTIIKGNLLVMEKHLEPAAKDNLLAANIAVDTLEYFAYDIRVSL